jgi:Lon protease-like protein
MSSLTPEDFDRFIAGRQARERQEHEALMRMYRAYHRAEATLADCSDFRPTREEVIAEKIATMDAKETLGERRLLAERKEEDR